MRALPRWLVRLVAFFAGSLSPMGVHAQEAPLTPAVSSAFVAGPYSRRVIFTTTRPALLEVAVWKIGTNDADWREVCSSPCVVNLVVNAQYRVTGPGVNESSAFVVPEGNGPLYVRSKTGSRALWTAGNVGTDLGAAAFAGGLIVDFINLICSGGECSNPNGYRTLKLAGPLLTLGGAVLIGTGLVLILSNRTQIEMKKTLTPPLLQLGRGVQIGGDGITF